MKLSPDSPELTAYALGELTPAERAEVEAALAESPELRAELESLQQTIGSLAGEFAAEPAAALAAEQRDAIMGLVTAESVAAGVTGLSPAAEVGDSSRRPVQPGGDSTLWERFLAWRQQMIWAAVGACALALALVFWPQQRDAVAEFNELRYQRLPAVVSPLPDASVTPAAPTAATRSLSAADQPGQAPVTRSKDKLETAVVSVPPAVSGPVRTSAPAPKADPAPLKAGRASTPASAAAPAVSPNSLPQDALARKEEPPLEPALARRYGLAPAAPPANGPARGTALRDGKAADANAVDSLAAVPAQRPATSLNFYGGKLPELEQKVRQRDTFAETESRELARGEVRLLEERLQPLGRTDWYYRQPTPGTEGYEQIQDNDFKSVATAPLSTFSLDVDTASYANVRRFLREGSLPPRDAVRLEELINYFRYDYPQPQGEHPFLASIELTDSPWKEGHKLVRIGLQARAMDRRERPAANLVFLLDVSGSMEPENKLPLVKRSLRLLLEKLTARDRVGIVTYAGESRIAAEPTVVDATGKEKLLTVIEGLRAGSGTHGSAGIQTAYAMATNQFNREHVNRVILCTDGDFNIGVTDRGELLNLITERAKSGVFLSVLGYGMGNLKDGTMELLADKGNGNYAYVDSFTEARKVLSEQLEGTLVTVAKDVKVQVEFNPARVKSYRLLGYENRALKDRDFNDDTKDAGEVGAGHQITVLYEIEPAVPNLAGVDPLRYQGKPEEANVKARLKPEHGDELLNLKLRYKAPHGDTSRLVETPVKDREREFAKATSDVKFATAVAGYGMLLRQSPHKGDLTWDKVLRLAEQGLGEDREGYRAEFVDLVRRAQQLSGAQGR